MADVQLVRSNLGRDDQNLVVDLFSSQSDFASCLSQSSPSSQSNRECNDSKETFTCDKSPGNGKGATQPTNLSAPRENQTYTGIRSRYGLEPMNLFFGPSDEPESKREQGRRSGSIDSSKVNICIKRIGDYDLIKTLGSGSTGKVKLAIHRKTQEKLAVKIVPRNQLEITKKQSHESKESREKRILREAAILNLIDHENIVTLKDFLVTQEYYCMFFEFVEGVQLLDFIIMNGKLPESKARNVFRQLLSAVDYCHNNLIVHRDLKIENIIITEESGKIKLLDFGLSNFFNPEEQLKTFCGSLYFAAPELLHGRQYKGPEVDVWSLGIILYVLVTGRVPFDDKNLSALHEKIKTCNLHIPHHVSYGCKELLTRMICRDPHQRASIDDVIFHPWVNNGYNSVPAYLPPERPPLEQIDQTVVSFLHEEFDMQFTREEINLILQRATENYSSAFHHPVISLYFLAKDKLLGSSGTIEMAKLQIDRKERSRSLSFIGGPQSSSSMKTRGNRKFSAPGASIRNNVASIQETENEENHLDPHSKRSILKRDKDEDIEFGIKTVYLKGFFSLNTTTTRSASSLRMEIQNYLILNNIRFEDCGSYFMCEYKPSIVVARDSNFLFSGNSGARQSRVLFEIHVVKVALLGLHGIQFKRIQGEAPQYKNLCQQMIKSLKL